MFYFHLLLHAMRLRLRLGLGLVGGFESALPPPPGPSVRPSNFGVYLRYIHYYEIKLSRCKFENANLRLPWQ